MGRILLMVLGGFVLLCAVCVGAGYFVALPRLQDELEANVEEGIATFVAPHIAGPGTTPVAGTYTMTESEVNQEIQSGDPGLEDLVMSITPSYIELHFGEQGRQVTYRAGVAAEEGRLVVVDPSLEGVPGWLLSEDAMTKGIENGINGYLAESGLVLTGVTLGEGEMTFETAEASSSNRGAHFG